MSQPDEVILALDIGGTWTRAAAITVDAEVLGSVTAPTRSDVDGSAVLEAILGLLTSVAAHVSRPVRGVGVSTTGPVDPSTGVLFRPPNTGPGLEGLRLGEQLSDALSLPVVVHPDGVLVELVTNVAGGSQPTLRIRLLG